MSRNTSPGMFGTKDVISAAEALIKLRDDYQRPPSSERTLDPVLYAFLHGKFPDRRISRQKHVRFPGARKPSLIDYRVGGPNPTLVEFVVRPPNGGSELYRGANKAELMKLSRIPAAQAKRGVLLLMDLREKPLPKRSLKASYARIHVGPGRIPRHPVTIVYVHRDLQYSFAWSP